METEPAVSAGPRAVAVATGGRHFQSQAHCTSCEVPAAAPAPLACVAPPPGSWALTPPIPSLRSPRLRVVFAPTGLPLYYLTVSLGPVEGLVKTLPCGTFSLLKHNSVAPWPRAPDGSSPVSLDGAPVTWAESGPPCSGHPG